MLSSDVETFPGSEKWWIREFSSLPTRFPQWTDCFRSIDWNYILGLAREMSSETGCRITAPSPEHIFRPFSDTDPMTVKLVVLGQDPYPTPGVACGRAFATMNGTIPASLRNLRKVLGSTCDPSLDAWVQQGVMLMNTAPVLTLAESGAMESWSPFTECVLVWLARTNRNVVFLLMGGFAKKFANVLKSIGVRVIETVHPMERSGRFMQENLLQRLNSIGIYLP